MIHINNNSKALCDPSLKVFDVFYKSVSHLKAVHANQQGEPQPSNAYGVWCPDCKAIAFDEAEEPKPKKKPAAKKKPAKKKPAKKATAKKTKKPTEEK